MTQRLHIDPVVLDAIADRLNRSGDALDATGTAAPVTPDAGPATPIVAGLLEALLAASAGLVGGLRDAGSRVTQARQAYARQDTDSGRSIRGAF